MAKFGEILFLVFPVRNFNLNRGAKKQKKKNKTTKQNKHQTSG